ncbi:hypothetical protein PR048_026729 [Dryococelus australis]|uniref:Uncharacterized protein n=1 Tax=Dryococelus australis TaxID=614101 RepID=A0ABQ9GM78_9NEOP|nr:hypothetical protein PR048_026729 [Dryococelus australis]
MTDALPDSTIHDLVSSERTFTSLKATELLATRVPTGNAPCRGGYYRHVSLYCSPEVRHHVNLPEVVFDLAHSEGSQDTECQLSVIDEFNVYEDANLNEMEVFEMGPWTTSYMGRVGLPAVMKSRMGDAGLGLCTGLGEEGLGKEWEKKSAMACDKDPLQHSPGKTSGNTETRHTNEYGTVPKRRGGGNGRSRENLPINCIVRHDSHLQKSSDPARNDPSSPWWEASRLTTQPPWPQHLIPNGITPGFSHVGIMPGDATGKLVFSGICRFLHPCIPVLLYIHLVLPSSALKSSPLHCKTTPPAERVCACARKGFPQREEDIQTSVKIFLEENGRQNPFENKTPGGITSSSARVSEDDVQG